MSEDLAPEQMPTEWKVGTFSREKGFGKLVHESGEEVIFNIDVWHLGGWQPSRKEVATKGREALGLPVPGERVRVRWKPSITSGQNVPALVQPIGRVSRKTYRLGAWMKGIQKHSGNLVGLTPAALLKALAKLDEDRAEEWRGGEPHEAEDFAFLLMDLGNVAAVDPAWAASHAGWIYTDDHRWDRERARRTLTSMLGVGSEAPKPLSGGDESLTEYVARCNAEASHLGNDVLLHEIALDADAHVFVAMKRSSFETLVKGGYVDAA